MLFRLPVNRAGQFFVMDKFSVRRHSIASVDSYSLFPQVFPADRFRPVKSPQMRYFQGFVNPAASLWGTKSRPGWSRCR